MICIYVYKISKFKERSSNRNARQSYQTRVLNKIGRKKNDKNPDQRGRKESKLLRFLGPGSTPTPDGAPQRWKKNAVAECWSVGVP